ncbi:putative pre-mRNA-splicing factor [Clavispora lusitaniae]|uniref:Pre-mRNA-splicing factor CWC15 n=1 Tax=Clavispora lusitaniae TaxID=36911 RepID=A0AA91PZ02_CLALS|nr:putative pre-mRNA-splicing factor [Clavispora lusitaniae]
MTTNHRPTLESKRGRSNEIKDSIKHSRALPGQLSMKLRSDIVGKHVDSSLGKRAVTELEESRKRSKYEEGDGKDTLSAKGSNNSEQSSESERGISDESEDEESDSESETELLMQELNKLKKEKEEIKREVTTSENPLLPPDETEVLPKKSWRSGTSFREKSNSKSDKQYTTDTLNSPAHQKFLSKYIR